MRSALVLFSVLLASALAGCGEKAPRADPERVRSYNAEAGPSLMRDRTLLQNESL